MPGMPVPSRARPFENLRCAVALSCALALPVGAQVPPAAASADASSSGEVRFTGRVTLTDGATVLVAEGESEPRSIGSYAIRAYAAGDPAFPTDRFAMGLVRPRDGTIERVLLADLDRDDRPEVVVVIRSAGTGGYLSADAFTFARGRLVRRASVAGLAADADPVAALQRRVRRATAP